MMQQVSTTAIQIDCPQSCVLTTYDMYTSCVLGSINKEECGPATIMLYDVVADSRHALYYNKAYRSIDAYTR